MVIGALTVLLSTTLAADWNSCADDLDRLKRAARDAADKANDLKSKADELENCRQYPSGFDYMRDKCRSKSSDFESAETDLKSQLGAVDSRIRSVRSSCGYNFGGTGTSKSSGSRQCDLYRSYKGQLPLESLLKTCAKSMPEAECKKCLAQD